MEGCFAELSCQTEQISISSANTGSVFPLRVNMHTLVLNVDPLRYSRVLKHQGFFF